MLQSQLQRGKSRPSTSSRCQSAKSSELPSDMTLKGQLLACTVEIDRLKELKDLHERRCTDLEEQVASLAEELRRERRRSVMTHGNDERWMRKDKSMNRNNESDEVDVQRLRDQLDMSRDEISTLKSMLS